MKRVVVGLSGGVDSSVAALLLKRQGFEVIGVSLKLYREESGAAERVARFLEIPLRVLDLRREFREKIMDYFAREYRRGRTPNPCALCNSYIKFRYLEKVRREEKAEFIATGHYARIVEKGRKFYLAPAKDRGKSQEYFLSLLPEDILEKTLFPLGNLTKEEVRKLAGNIAAKRESQDICFVRERNYHKFLEKEYGFLPKKGDIITTWRKKIGQHNGFYKFTVGQRRGIGVSSTQFPGGAKGPLYVVKILPEENAVVVGEKEQAYRSEIKVELKLWKGTGDGNYRVRIRYRHPGAEAKVKIEGNIATVNFLLPQFAPAPGQLAVFYDEEELVVGAGFIF